MGHLLAVRLTAWRIIRRPELSLSRTRDPQGTRAQPRAAALNGKIDRAYYGHIERATKNATLPTIWKMANALDVPPSALFTRADRILAQEDEEARPRPAR